MALDDQAVRLEVYRHFVTNGRAPSPAELARRFAVAPPVVEGTLHRLQDDADALVLLPGSPYIWMAEPFSALPTNFQVLAKDGRRWWGNCIWDALAILALVGIDGAVSTACPDCGDDLNIHVVGQEPAPTDAVVHFAVPARSWWQSIGFT